MPRLPAVADQAHPGKVHDPRTIYMRKAARSEARYRIVGFISGRLEGATAVDIRDQDRSGCSGLQDVLVDVRRFRRGRLSVLACIQKPASDSKAPIARVSRDRTQQAGKAHSDCCLQVPCHLSLGPLRRSSLQQSAQRHHGLCQRHIRLSPGHPRPVPGRALQRPWQPQHTAGRNVFMSRLHSQGDGLCRGRSAITHSKR